VSMSWTLLNPITPNNDRGIESLTSFVTRVAASHLVRTRSLLRFVGNVYSDQNAISTHWTTDVASLNGLGIVAEQTTKLIGIATGAEGLRRATFANLKNVVPSSAHGLLYRNRRICPACFREDRDCDGFVHDRLTWSFMPIDTCPAHRTPLVDKCPRCSSQLKYLAQFPDLGSCVSCRFDLSTTRQSFASPARVARAGYFSHEVEELVSRHEPLAASGLITYLNQMNALGVSFQEIAEAAGLDKAVIRDWRTKKRRPRVLSLMALSAAWGVSTAAILENPIEAAASSVRQDGVIDAIGLGAGNRRAYARTNHSEAKRILTEIEENISLYTSEGEIASRVGIKAATLLYHYGDRLKVLSEKHRRWSREMRREQTMALVTSGVNLLREWLQKGVHLKRIEFVALLMERTGCTKTKAKHAYTDALDLLSEP